MLCAQVMGKDATIGIAGQAGNFQLNVMLPVIADNLLESIDLLANGARSLADQAIAGFSVNLERLNQALARNPILVTALNPVLGYEKGAAIAKQAYAQNRSILEVAREMTELTEDELVRSLNPARLAEGGLLE
jgi:fumarate hydratase class II